MARDRRKNREKRRIERVMERTNSFGRSGKSGGCILDLTPYNIGRKEIVVK